MRAIVILPFLILALGCDQGAPEPAAGNASAVLDTTSAVADVEALRAAGQRALVAFREGDAETLDALYAENAVLVNPGAEPLDGSAAIDSLHRYEMSRPGYVVDWESIRVEVAESGDLGYDFGRWSTRSADGSVEERGYYVNVFRKVDGTWRTVVELNGSSAPNSP